MNDQYRVVYGTEHSWPRWGSVCTRTDLATGVSTHSCMYCYRPWHDLHWCGEPDDASADAEGSASSSDLSPKEEPA